MDEPTKSELLEKLFDPKKLTVIKLFLNHVDKAFYLREISKDCKVPVATTFRIVKQLVDLGIISQFEVSHAKLYRLAENANVKFLESFMTESVQILQLFMKKAREIKGVVSIIQHGKAEKDGANVLLIGDGIDSGDLKRLCGSVKEEYKFNIHALALSQEQFAQMSQMGLYSGEKKVLWEKE